jgi:hypothetical protein
MTSVIFFRNSGSRFRGTCPATLTSPALGCRSPESIFSVVVLPAPFGPRKPTRSPGSTWKSMPSTALTSSYLR